MEDPIQASDALKAEPTEPPSSPHLSAPVNVKYKSWRKKYRKMRQCFDDSMEEANNLFLATHHLQEVAQRLQEQNDQLLEILTDLNTSSQVSPQHRYDVALPSSPSLTPPRKSKAQLPAAELRLVDLERDTPITLPSLLPELPVDLQDADGSPPDGYLTPKHEEEYLGIIDNALDVIPLPSPSRPNIILDASVDLRPRHTSPPTERDFAISCPVSVHNWLSRNKPTLRNDDASENASVTGGPSNSGGGGKKKKGQSAKERTKEDAPFEGLDDEIGFDVEEGAGKRKKRAEDQTYRPKGGRSKAKRKRGLLDDGEEERGGKKVRADGDD